MVDSNENFFPEYGNNYSFPEFEEQILAFWNSQQIFQKSIDQKSKDKSFRFYDGPPFATGLPHYGHLLAGTIKDIVPRYWTMRGYRVERKFGWDCHGLPIEFEMEKKLGLNGSLEIMDYGVAKFNEACRGIVLKYSNDWKQTVTRMGRWVDMENDYKTMDSTFMESVWWVFKQLWDEELIYEGRKVVPYSWRLTAPLSNFEASLNYKSVQDPAVTVLFPLVKDSSTALSIWTTTPWTLPSNLAIAVNPREDKIIYAKYKLKQSQGGVENVICEKGSEEKFGLNEDDFIELISNKELNGLSYEPLFSVFSGEKENGAFKVIAADYVQSGNGTGLVHNAPAFGEEDFYACQAVGLKLVDPTDMQANFTAEVTQNNSGLDDIVGLFVKDADKALIKIIKEKGLLLKQETIQHNVAFCERSDTPLIYKAIPSWFVNVEKIKDKMLENAKEISWVPGHIKEGRFGKWLEGARDWCISRNRFWGTPIPVWRCSKTGQFKVIGSKKELEEFVGQPVDDLHKHFVDEFKPASPAGGVWERTTEVLDCWFESGSMPYASEHYPFENKEKFSPSFPADFIAEGLDQTRCWFYNLMVLSTALFDKPAFKNVIVNGIVLAEDGKKMSKRLRNYPDPMELISEHGADAIRLYLMQSPAMRAEDLRFSKQGLVQLKRSVMIPLWNSYSFFASYANIDSWDYKKDLMVIDDSFCDVDCWIWARLNELEFRIHEAMKDYKLYEVAPLSIAFIDDLTNWYIRLNRDRFWGAKNEDTLLDKKQAYSTLYQVLERLCLLLGPGLPYFSEYLNAALKGFDLKNMHGVSEEYKSIHLKEFDSIKEMSVQDATLVEEFSQTFKVILLGRALRGEAKIGLRQPLKSLKIAGLNQEQQKLVEKQKNLILDELNIKELIFVENEEDLVTLVIKPNFKTLGRKAGKSLKSIQKTLLEWTKHDLKVFQEKGSLVVEGVELLTEDVDVMFKEKPGKLSLSLEGIVGELDPEINDALKKEGLQREIVNRIQQRRKEMDFHLADRIQVKWNCQKKESLLVQVMKEDQEYIAQETLAENFVFDNTLANANLNSSLGEHGELCFELTRI